jgi:hypothetical protein
MTKQLAGVNGRVDRATEGAKGFCVSKGRGVNGRLFAIILAGIKSGEGEAKKGHMFIRDIRNCAQRLTLAAKWGKLIRSVVKYVAMRRSRMRVNFIWEKLRRDTRQGKVKAKAAQIFRKHQSLKKFLAGQVVGANVDERSFEALAVEKAMKNGHCLSVIRGGMAERTAGAIRMAVEKQNIAPTRGACTRVLVSDSRAIGNKNCMLVVWRGSQKRGRELNIGGCKDVDARFKPITKRGSRFRLRKPAKWAKTRGEPRGAIAMGVEFITNELRGGRV